MIKAVVGANWGDEGKGKITDMLAEKADIIVRFQGGANAGHTIVNDYGKFALHTLPSGVFYNHTTSVIGNGVALNVPLVFKEIQDIVRSLVLKIRHCDYVEAAIVTGSKTPYMILRYMLPNALPTLIITAATDIGGMMLELAAMSFLGFGAKPPAPEWGYMLNEGRACIQSAPWMMIFPGLAIFVVVVVFNMLGDSLRDILDPKDE